MSRFTYLMVYLLLVILFAVFKYKTDPLLAGQATRQSEIIVWVIYLAFALLVLSCSVRRLHDVGQRGWLALLLFVPVVNLLLQGHLFFGKSERGPNIYGEQPL